MTKVLSQYLSIIRNNLRLDHASEREVISELETHIEDELDEMKAAGLSEEEAVDICIEFLGSAKVIARKIYEAHSQGTWKQALWASMPHLLFALLFTLNWWQGIGWFAVMLVLVFVTAVYGWWRGKPAWLFSWLGYSLLPVVVAGLLLLYLPRGWSWLAIIVYIPLALWLVYAITIQTIKRDWLYGALMLLPVPVIIGWYLAVEQGSGFLELSLEHIHQFAPWIGLSFLTLAVTVALFIRLRQRWLRVALLLVAGLLTLGMVVYYTEGRLGFLSFLVLTMVMLGLLLGPVLVERRIRFGKQRLMA